MLKERSWQMIINKAACKGMDTCSICQEIRPGISDIAANDRAGIIIREWAMAENRDTINRLVEACPRNAILIDEL